MAEMVLVHKILVFSISFISGGLALLVYFSDRKSRVNQFFSVLAISVIFWMSFYYLTITSADIQSAVLWSKLAYASVSIFFIPFYFFFVYFFHIEKKYLFLNKLVLVLGLVLFVISFFTDWIVKGAILKDGKVDLIFNVGNLAFYGIAILLSIIVIGILLRHYLKFSLQDKLRAQYFLIGVFVWVFLNFIFNMVFPLLQKSVEYAEFGNYSVIFLLGFMAYAIVKRELFGIKIVLTTALVGAIAALLALDIFVFTPLLILQLYKALVLVLFIYFGYLLIKSVLREIKYREQIKRAYDVEKRAHRELERLDAAKTQFMMATQHHLRTPLTAMIGYLDLIFGGTYGKVYPKVRTVLQKLKISTERLNKVINELLDISKFELGKKVVSLEPDVKIEPLLKEIIEELQFEVKAKNLYLKFQKPKKLPTIKADPEKLKVALANIIDNAVKYTLKGGVTIKAETMGSKVLVSVKDTGIGVLEGEEKDLFSRTFERGKGAKEANVTGKGIGLYITGHIVKAHNGRIWAESEGKDKGSTFYIELPTS